MEWLKDCNPVYYYFLRLGLWFFFFNLFFIYDVRSQDSRYFFFYKSIAHFKKIYLFIYFWLCWVFVSVQGLSLVAASGGHSSSRCAGLSLSRPLVAEHKLQMRRLSSCGSRT